VGGAASGRSPTTGALELSDILAGHPADQALLAELYDLEHDEIAEDIGFYREQARRSSGSVIDLGCGSGRLFSSLLVGDRRGLVGVDGSAALLDRAEERIRSDPRLSAAREAGRIELMHADLRNVRRRDRFGLAVLVGVLAHLDGPEAAVRVLDAVRRLLEPGGALIVDSLGPGGQPSRDLPLSIDWEREMGDRRVVRRSSLVRRETPEGLRVEYSTLTDLLGADGTINRLPAGFRLWYPSVRALLGLAGEAQLAVDATFGSHDLDPLDERSERCILVLRPVRRSGMR
jgi:SAM-dependent methyltransferase